jgi:hypothetical protein
MYPHIPIPDRRKETPRAVLAENMNRKRRTLMKDMVNAGLGGMLSTFDCAAGICLITTVPIVITRCMAVLLRRDE